MWYNHDYWVIFFYSKSYTKNINHIVFQDDRLKGARGAVQDKINELFIRSQNRSMRINFEVLFYLIPWLEIYLGQLKENVIVVPYWERPFYFPSLLSMYLMWMGTFMVILHTPYACPFQNPATQHKSAYNNQWVRSECQLNGFLEIYPDGGLLLFSKKNKTQFKSSWKNVSNVCSID